MHGRVMINDKYECGRQRSLKYTGNISHIGEMRKSQTILVGMSWKWIVLKDKEGNGVNQPLCDQVGI